MTPPIRLWTDTSTATSSPAIPVPPAAAVAGDGAAAPVASQFVDYAYRIAALTVGLALLTTFI